MADRYLSVAQKNQELGKAVLLSEVGPAQIKYINALHELVKLQEQKMQDSRKTAEEGICSVRNTVLVTGSLARIAAVLFVVVLTQGVTEPLIRSVRTLRAIAVGDVAVKFDTTGQGKTGALLLSLKDMQNSLAHVVAQVRQGSEGVATASAEIFEGNSDLSSHTESQASALEQTAASMEELAAHAVLALRLRS